MAAKKNRVTLGFEAAAVSTVSILLAACAPREVTPPSAPTLPMPVVRITHAPTIAPIQPSPTSTPLAQIPIPKSDIQKMADELYGARQIEQISIPALDVESRVRPVGWRIQFAEELQSSEFEWDSPEADVGWVITSALPDETGNVILYGHNNLYTKVFEHLADLVEGDKIYLQTGVQSWEYEARHILILPVVGASQERVRNYQKYLQPTQDARITLISCWPPISNTHRVVVIGYRVTEP